VDDLVNAAVQWLQRAMALRGGRLRETV